MTRARVLTLFLMVLACLLIADSAWAVSYNRRTGDGTYLFKCQGFCGAVKVTQVAKGVYRVISIPFSGEVRAGSAKSAARFACQEAGTELEAIVKPTKERSGPQC